jgi:sn-glycerol 3-phosphate transport system ATP-binding protein
MRREIRALQQKLGITMVYVTHDQSEAMSMADQVILMRDGRVEQAGPPDELYARPATTFAARFIGTPPMSILPAPDRGDLLFGIRPEDVMLGDTGLPVRVQSSEFLGADTVVTCSYGNQTLTARVPGKAVFAAGAAIHARWRAEHMHVFDAASGARRDDVRAPADSDTIGLVQNFA